MRVNIQSGDLAQQSMTSMEQQECVGGSIYPSSSWHNSAKLQKDHFVDPIQCQWDIELDHSTAAFQATLITEGIKPAPTTAKNPQANAACERAHSTIGSDTTFENCNKQHACRTQDTTQPESQFFVGVKRRTQKNILPTQNASPAVQNCEAKISSD